MSMLSHREFATYLLIGTLLGAVGACGSQSLANSAGSGGDPAAIGDFSDRPGWECDAAPIASTLVSFGDEGATTQIESNGVARHATGTFPNSGNPNRITQQRHRYAITNTQEKRGYATDTRIFGVTLDGIPLERDTAESWRNQREWRYEAITPAIADGTGHWPTGDWLGTDCNNAHVQPNGKYHYHGMMEGLLIALVGSDTPQEMVLGGYAADGFPFYLRYGYADPADRASGLVPMQASWELKSGTRPNGPGGAYDGEFREDWEFVAGSGDLDQCGGRFGPTPEYPAGIYHYYVTDDYPYIPRCVMGTPDPSFTRRPDGPPPGARRGQRPPRGERPPRRREY